METSAPSPLWFAWLISVSTAVIALAGGVHYSNSLLGKLERKEYLKRLPPGLVGAMEDWWRQTSMMRVPQLASSEAKRIVTHVTSHLNKDGHRASLAVVVSFVLTTFAFLLGYIILLIATIVHWKVAVFTGSAVQLAVPKPIKPWRLVLDWMPVLIPLALYLYLLMRAVWQPNDRQRLIYRCTAWYLVALFGLFSLQGAIASASHQPARSVLYLVGSVVCVAPDRSHPPATSRFQYHLLLLSADD